MNIVNAVHMTKNECDSTVQRHKNSINSARSTCALLIVHAHKNNNDENTKIQTELNRQLNLQAKAGTQNGVMIFFSVIHKHTVN